MPLICLVPFTLTLAEEFRAGEGEFGEERYQSINYLSKICEMSQKTELSGEELMNWRLWSAYHMYFFTRCEFHVYPKHHWFMYFPAQIERTGVPRGFWVYSEESKKCPDQAVVGSLFKGPQRGAADLVATGVASGS